MGLSTAYWYYFGTEYQYYLGTYGSIIYILHIIWAPYGEIMCTLYKMAKGATLFVARCPIFYKSGPREHHREAKWYIETPARPQPATKQPPHGSAGESEYHEYHNTGYYGSIMIGSDP